MTINQLERLYPGVSAAIARLNVKTGAANADEGFAAWLVEMNGDALSVSVIQPHYVKGDQKSFWWDAEEFV